MPCFVFFVRPGTRSCCKCLVEDGWVQGGTVSLLPTVRPLTLHSTRPTPHGASRLVQAMSTRSVKTGRAPSRQCRDARVYDDYGHTWVYDRTTTAMHDTSIYPPPIPSFSYFCDTIASPRIYRAALFTSVGSAPFPRPPWSVVLRLRPRMTTSTHPPLLPRSDRSDRSRSR